MGDWGAGLGMLYIFIDDMYSPVLITPLNLAATIHLENGRAFVGLTAATGDEHWQAHDILGWQFTSNYEDLRYEPPLIVNGQGDYQCVNESVCVNHVDYDHYYRSNKKWGPTYDDVESWMTGMQGFCAFC